MDGRWVNVPDHPDNTRGLAVWPMITIPSSTLYTDPHMMLWNALLACEQSSDQMMPVYDDARRFHRVWVAHGRPVGADLDVLFQRDFLGELR